MTSRARIIRRAPLMSAVVAVASALVAPTAWGSSIYQRSGGGDADLVYAGGSAENNVITIREITISGVPSYEFVESNAGITGVYSICTLHTPQRATCPRSMPDGTPLDADAEVHGGADTVDMRTTSPAGIWAGAGADTVRGGSSNDTIFGYDNFSSTTDPDGDDWIDGRGGADAMFGGPGTDTVSYESRSTAVTVKLDTLANDGGFGEGDDVDDDVEVVRGTSAGDTFIGNSLANRFHGGDGFDLIEGLGGQDTLFGGETVDRLEGGSEGDSLFGEGGADSLYGGPGADAMDGGADDDGMRGGPGADDMVGGPGGADAADYAGSTVAVTATADDLPGDGAAGEGDNVHRDVERIFGGSGPDTLTPDTDGGEVWGRAGEDTLFGSNSDDLLDGGADDDRLDGRFGADVLNGGGGVDTLDYTGHYDPSLEPFGVSSTPDGQDNDGNGTLDLSAGNGPYSYDTVGADVENLIGSAGPDFLQGTAARNLLDGRLGGDIFDGADGVDTVTYADRTAPVRVTINGVANDGETGEGDDVATTIENVRGGDGDDVLTGSPVVNRLFGGNGGDNLNGGDGADVLDGQAGVDTINYSNRAEPVAVTLDGLRNDGADPNGSGVSNLSEEGDQDLDIENATGGLAGDILRAPIANAVANVLRGLGGDDTLEAREGTATVDNLVCGDGVADRVAADPSDTTPACEIALP